MKYNMNFYDIALRYAIGYLIIMAGTLTQQLPLVLLGVPFLMVGLLGICPVFKVLGIDHNNFESHHTSIQDSKVTKDSPCRKTQWKKEAA